MDIIATGHFGPNVPAAGMPAATATGGFFALALSGAGMVPASGQAAGMPAGAGQAATQLGVSTLFEISPAPGLPASPLAAATLTASVVATPATPVAPDATLLHPAVGEPVSARLPNGAAPGAIVPAKSPSPAASAQAASAQVPAPAHLLDPSASPSGTPTGEGAALVDEPPLAAPSVEPRIAKEADVPTDAKAAADPVTSTPFPIATTVAVEPPAKTAALGLGSGDTASAPSSATAATAGEASVLVGAAPRAGASPPAPDGEMTAAPDFEAAMAKAGGEPAATSSRPGEETPAPADRTERSAAVEKAALPASQPTDPASRPAAQPGTDRASGSANPAPAPAIGPAPAAQASQPAPPPTAVAAAAHPVPAEAQPPILSARSGRMGRDMGVEIARRVAGGGEELVIRLDPAELGRIHIRMVMNEQGHLRAVVAADAPAALEALRQEIGDLGRALEQAGVKTDSDSIRFDRGGSGGDNGSAWQRYQGQDRSRRQETGLTTPPDDVPQQPTVRANRRVDLMA